MSKAKKQLYDPMPIRVAMAQKNLNPTDASKKVKMHPFTFRKIRNGQDVTLSTLLKAARGLGLEVEIQIKAA
jgi:hypothetical protein